MFKPVLQACSGTLLLRLQQDPELLDELRFVVTIEEAIKTRQKEKALFTPATSSLNYLCKFPDLGVAGGQSGPLQALEQPPGCPASSLVQSALPCCCQGPLDRGGTWPPLRC